MNYLQLKEEMGDLAAQDFTKLNKISKLKKINHHFLLKNQYLYIKLKLFIMTPLEYTLLATNILGMVTIYILQKEYKRINKEYKEYLLESVTFFEDTLKDLDKLQTALDEVKTKPVVKPKTPKNEKKTITK